MSNAYTMTAHFPYIQEFTDDTALAVKHVHSEAAPNSEMKLYFVSQKLF